MMATGRKTKNRMVKGKHGMGLQVERLEDEPIRILIPMCGAGSLLWWCNYSTSDRLCRFRYGCFAEIKILCHFGLIVGRIHDDG